MWFTEYGFGRLETGRALISIDPLFAETVNLSEPYHVFVQLNEADAEGVAVINYPPTWTRRFRPSTRRLLPRCPPPPTGLRPGPEPGLTACWDGARNLPPPGVTRRSPLSSPGTSYERPSCTSDRGMRCGPPTSSSAPPPRRADRHPITATEGERQRRMSLGPTPASDEFGPIPPKKSPTCLRHHLVCTHDGCLFAPADLLSSEWSDATSDN